MIKQYRKDISLLRAGSLSNSELHIKQDEITYADFEKKRVYKRVFRTDLASIEKDSKNLPVARILESYHGEKDTEFVLELVEGCDIFVYIRNNPKLAEETLIQFENFLAQWVNYSNEKDYLESYSFDINPGNFILNPETKTITKIDYLSDWAHVRQELFFYLLPFKKLIDRGVVEEKMVATLINKRFQNHASKPNYNEMLAQLNSSSLIISSSNS